MELPNCIKIILTFAFLSLIANVKSDGKKESKKEKEKRLKGTVLFI